MVYVSHFYCLHTGKYFAINSLAWNLVKWIVSYKEFVKYISRSSDDPELPQTSSMLSFAKLVNR